MGQRSLPQWLQWQESLHTNWIELDLDRLRTVAGRLDTPRPGGPVFAVAGTNGKGSTAALLEAFLRRAGFRTGLYTSPHLVHYNERVRVAGSPVGDQALIAAFERIEAVRGQVPLTFFEFGTLAALDVFNSAGVNAWVLEVGMGGRLDAVNIVDADFSLITTVDLDHQEFLGDTVHKIAAEKAGILRRGRPGFFGDWPVPDSIREAAGESGARLHCLGEHFDFSPSRPAWAWRGRQAVLDGLHYPPGATLAQLRNISLVLAALEQFDPGLLADLAAINELIVATREAGRFQVVQREHQWVLDVAHNPQAAATLRAQLQTLAGATDGSIVLGLLGDKNLDAFPAELSGFAQRWITCSVDDPRARPGASLAEDLIRLGAAGVMDAGTVEDALEKARALTAPGGRIIVCGSFRVVGPALRWLGIY